MVAYAEQTQVAPTGAGQMAPAGAGLMGFLPIILIVVIFYLLIILPQQKKDKELKKMTEELKKGDKVINKIKFPKWIWQRKSYQIACIRGLFDTDGGLYFHIHKKWKNKKPYLGWCFSSSSKNLINDYLRALSNLGLNAKKAKEDRIYIYNFSDIEKYMNLVDTNNIKNAEKFNKYLEIKKVN